MADNDPTTTTSSAPRRSRKRRWDSSANPQEEGKDHQPAVSKVSNNNVAPVSTASAATTTTTATASADPRARAAALQASIQARLAALKARTAGSSTQSAATSVNNNAITATQTNKKRALDTTTNNSTTSTTNNDQQSTKKARVYELDMSVTAPTRISEQKAAATAAAAASKSTEAQKNRPKLNPYLAHTQTNNNTNDTTTSNKSQSQPTVEKQQQPQTTYDPRLSNGQITKSRPHHRPLNFITPGTYIAMGQTKREMAARAEASGYVSGRKVGNVIRSVGMVSVASTNGEDATGSGGGGGGGGGGYYGMGEAGKVMEERLPSRMDAPEVNLDEYTKTTLVNKKDVEDASNTDLPVLAALRAVESTMPYAMEWWDAELLPKKVRRELAEEEGRVIASRARRQGGGGGGVKKAAASKSAANNSDGDNNDNLTPIQQYQSQQEQHNLLLQKCYNTATLTNSKTHSLIQHPVPIITPAQRAAQEALKNKPPTLHLTKAEQKRHRKLRRAERQREQQDLQAAGLIPPPEPRLTLANYMKVLGDQAVLDPSKMEARVMEQIQARKLKHERMNAERKLTKEQRSAKHARKLQEDTTQSISVALYWVRDMGHPYHRAKVDLNAQQNSITGGVLECETGEWCLVVAEGGEKAVRRYTRLMTVRMKWKGEDFYEEEEEEDLMEVEGDGEDGAEAKKLPRKKFNPNNECELIWTGMAVKRAFQSFMFQTAANSSMARKILEAKGVAHYWDLAAGHYESKVGSSGGLNGGDDGALRFRLG